MERLPHHVKRALVIPVPCLFDNEWSGRGPTSTAVQLYGAIAYCCAGADNPGPGYFSLDVSLLCHDPGR